MKYLLDTCTFIWVVEGSGLPPHVADVVRAPENEIFLSAASCWEIALKYALGRLPLADQPERVVPAERHAHGIKALAIDEESVLHLWRLPRLHRDPFDRILVAQAVVHGLTILTPDPEIARYPARTMW